MPEVMEIEARIKNLISSEMSTIIKSVEEGSRKIEDASKRQTSSSSLLSRSIGDLKSSWNIAAMAAGSFVGAMGAMSVLRNVSNLFKTATEEAVKQVEAEQLLASTLGRTSKELISFADSMQRSTTFGDEEFIQAEAMIGAYIKEDDNIKQVTRAAMNLATVKRMDLRSAADLLTKSIISGTNSLSRYGIHIEDTTDVSRRMESALQSVNTAFGGVAEAMAKTDVGKMKQLNNLISDQKEMLGKELVPLINEWRSLMLDLGGSTIPVLSKIVHGVAIEFKLLKGESLESIKTMEYISEAMKKGGQEGAAFLFDRLTDLNKKYGELQIRQKEFREGKDLWHPVDPKQLKDYERQIALTKEALSLLTKIQSVQSTQKTTSNFDIEKENENIKKAVDEQEKIRQHLIFSVKEQQIEAQKAIEETDKENLKIAEEISNEKYKLEEARIGSLSNQYTQELELFKLEQRKELSEFQGTEEAKKIIIERQLISLANEEKKINKKKQEDDKEFTKQKVDNIEFATDATFKSIGMLAKASKASSGLQKTIDIAQATANTAIAVTRALATPGGKWQIPFIIALGAAQVATIASAKYAEGGIIKGESRSGDLIPISANAGEMILNDRQQSNLFDMINRPNSYVTNNTTSNSNSAIHLNINLNGGNYDMSAAKYTVDSLSPVIADAIIKAKNEGRLRGVTL